MPIESPDKDTRGTETRDQSSSMCNYVAHQLGESTRNWKPKDSTGNFIANVTNISSKRCLSNCKRNEHQFKVLLTEVLLPVHVTLDSLLCAKPTHCRGLCALCYTVVPLFHCPLCYIVTLLHDPLCYITKNSMALYHPQVQLNVFTTVTNTKQNNTKQNKTVQQLFCSVGMDPLKLCRVEMFKGWWSCWWW